MPEVPSQGWRHDSEDHSRPFENSRNHVPKLELERPARSSKDEFGVLRSESVREVPRKKSENAAHGRTSRTGSPWRALTQSNPASERNISEAGTQLAHAGKCKSNTRSLLNYPDAFTAVAESRRSACSFPAQVPLPSVLSR